MENKIMALSAVEVSAGVPEGTPTSGWFTIPEGELGQVTNALSTMGHSLNPLHMLSLSGLRGIMDDTIQSIKQTVGLAAGQQTAWTAIHATNAAQVYALEQSTGQKPYTTKADAMKHSGAQNRNVSQSGSAADLFHGLNLQSWMVRIGEILLGVVLIGVGVAKLTGTSNVISTAAKVAI